MKKALIAFLSIVLIGSIFTGCLFEPRLTEEEKVSVGIGTVLIVGFSEIYYALNSYELEGMSGTIGEDGSIDVTWTNFDWGAMDPTDDLDPGAIVMSGTHKVTISGTTLTSKMDVTIKLNTDDAPTGTFKVILEIKTLDYESDDSTPEIIKFTVNGSSVDLDLIEDELW